MEGSGEGIVAILQGLNDTRLVLTVLSRQRDQRRRASNSKLAVKPYEFKNSVETSTDLTNQDKISKKVQISDDRYASCYQIAHCRVKPSSPPVLLTEFPPQRSKPSTSLGNFEIGSPGSSIIKSFTRTNGLREDMKWPKTGIVSRCNDAFVESLRKYPRLSPEKSVSSELLEKLLRHRTKRCQSANRTKSMKSLHKENMIDQNPIHNSSIDNKVSDIEKRRDKTRKRERSDSRKEELCASRKEFEMNTPEDVYKQTSSKSIKWSRRIHSPTNDKYISRRVSPSKTTYNYLKFPPSQYIQRPETFPLEEIDKRIHNTLKLMNRRPVVLQVCPKIQRRYNQHKKNCAVKSPSTSTTNEPRKKASIPGLCQLLSAIQNACERTSCSKPTSQQCTEMKECCHCSKASQCSCTPDKKDNDCQCSPKTNDKSTQPQTDCRCEPDRIKPDSVELVCQWEPTNDVEYYVNKIDEIVTEWLNEIPIRSNENPEDKIQRQNIVNSLADKLKQLNRDYDHVEDKIREPIEKAVFMMPMWSPGSSDDKERFKIELVEKLLSKINNIPKTPEKLRESVKNFVNGINFDDDLVNIEEVINNLAQKIHYLVNNLRRDENETKDLLVTEIKSVLEELSTKFYCSSEGTKSESKIATMRNDNEMITKPKPIYTQSPQQDGFIFDDGEEARDSISVKLRVPTPEQSSAIKKTDFMTAVSKNLSDIIADSNLPESKKKDLFSGSTEFIEAQVDKIFSGSKTNIATVKNAIERNISQTLNQLSIPRNTKNKIKQKLLQAVNKNLSDALSQETGVPITSTPKKSRKTWVQGSEMLSTIPDDDFIQFLHPEESEYWTQIVDTIGSWIDNLSIPINDETKKEVKKGLLNDVGDRQKYLQMNPNAKKKIQEELENLEYQIFRRFNKVLGDGDMEVIMKAADVLMESMKEIKVPNLTQEYKEHEYKQRLRESISETLPEQEDLSANEQAAFELMKNNLADAFISLNYSGIDEEQKNKFKKKIDEVINKCCDDYLENNTRLSLNMEKLNQSLYDELKKLPIPGEQSLQSIVKQVHFKDVINSWFEELPLKEQSPLERLEIFKKADTLANVLENIERNNDNVRNQDVKQKMVKEITNFMSKLPLKPGYDNSINSYTNILIENLNATKSAIEFNASTEHSIQMNDDTYRVLDSKETAQYEYQQQLRDTISKILPEWDDLPSDEQAAIELMKNDLADAFISLHYSGVNEEQRNKFKKQIDDAINKFCNDYLKNYPGTPLNIETLNQNLYSELKKVPLPTEGSLLSILEQIQIKDVINDWYKELPSKEQTALERLDVSKKIVTLAKILEKIKRNNDNLSDQELKQKMGKEISKFLQKLPLNPKYDIQLDALTTKLIEKLKVIETASKDSSTRHSDQMSRDRGSLYPPCSISPEDREHLKRIKQRTCMAPDCLSSILKKHKKNESVSSLAMDVGSQTEYNFEYSDICPIAQGSRQVPLMTIKSKPQRVTIPCAQTGSQTKVPPPVLIKEYYWDSGSTPKRRGAESCGTRKEPRTPRYTDRRRLLYQSPSLCPGSKLIYHRCIDENPSQTCQDMLSGPSSHIPLPSSPKLPNTSEQSSLRQSFVPFLQSTPRNSDDVYTSRETRGDNFQPEYSNLSSNMYPRKDRVTDLGSLDDLRRPSQQKRLRPDNLDWSTSLPEESESPCMRHLVMSDRLPRDARVKYKNRHKTNFFQNHDRSPSRRDCDMEANSNDPVRQWSTHCSQCSRCPYPSYLYFRQ